MALIDKPTIPGQTDADNINKDIVALEMAELRLQEMKEALHKLLVAVKTIKNPMLWIQEVMMLRMGVQGAQMEKLSAIDNIASDMRSDITDAQGKMNIATKDKNVIEQKKALKDLTTLVNRLDAFLKQQSTAKDPVMDSDTIKNMQTAIQNVKSPFGTHWGHPDQMSGDVHKWVMASISKYSPQLKEIQDGFQTLNQSTSALSTTTNTSLQFNDEQYKQFMGIDEDSNQAFLKFEAAVVQNQRAN